MAVLSQQQFNDALSHYHAGEFVLAQSNFQAILSENTQHAEANYYLGLILLEDKQAQLSLPYFKAALESDPQTATYWVAYINALVIADEIEDAQLVLSYAIEAGLADDLVATLSASIQRHLNHMNSVALVDIEHELIYLFSEKNYALLESRALSYLAQNPDWLNGWKILSDTYLIQGKDAKFAASKALALNAEDANEHCYYGLILKKEGDLIGAAKAFAEAIQLKPDYAAAHNNLGIVKKDLGDVEAGIRHYSDALKINPNYASCFSNLLFCLSHFEKCDTEALYKEHIKFSQQYELPLKAKWLKHKNINTPERPLKIGFVSADFRDHSVAYCFGPLLKSLAQSNQLQLYAYYNHTIVDETTRRLQSQFLHWHDVEDWSDYTLVKHIQDDAIDILVDLSGHTAGNRLTAFAMKPAPIQASWFGYLATTGLTSMDYYLADPYLLPPQKFDTVFSEKIVRLPVNAPFMPNQYAPEVNELPAIKNRYLTFGCFNRPSKISHATIVLWSSLLKANPTAKLLLGAMPQIGSFDTLIASFVAQGISAERLQLHVRNDLNSYLKLHYQVDICLDTIPSSGITTTFHAAWMGVPTLCLDGKSLTSRGAMAIMSHLGLQTFVAKNSDDFVAIGVHWAGHLNALNHARNNMRAQFKQSAIAKPDLLAVSLEKAFRRMWKTWCVGQPVKSFDVLDN